MSTTATGPIDRVHFLDDQRRNRRASWRFSLFAFVAALLSGIPLSFVLSPLLFAVILLAAHLLEVVIDVPADVWVTLDQLAHIVPTLWATVRGAGEPAPWGLLLTILTVPGSIVMLVVWLWIRVVFRRVGVGGVLTRLSARPPDPGTLREAQIRNIVEELAIAAAVAPPRVLMIDSKAANAAAVGLTIEDATIVVTTGFLELDRDERKAILAHVVGSVGNGDLKIASTMLTLFQTWGVLALLTDVPFGPRSRRALRHFVSTSRRALRGETDRRRAAIMLDRVMDGASLKFEDLYEHTDLENVMSRPLVVGMFVDVPLYLTLGVAAVAAKASIALFTLMVFGPWIGLSWKARRSLADATAVQLTRDPDALARAVARMEGRTAAIEGADPVSFLFPFWTRWTPEVLPKGDDVTSNLVRMHLPLEKRLGALLRLGASPESIADAPATKDDPTTARDVFQLAGMTLLAVALVGACIAFSFLTMALVLWGLWALLQLIFFWSD